MARIIDLTGRRFGQLTVIELSSRRASDNGAYWVCRCDCGNTCEARASKLKSGDNKSCGCLGKEKSDLQGKRFGELVAISQFCRLDIKQKERPYWRCQCDCGNEYDVRADALQNGSTTSCRFCRPEYRSEYTCKNPACAKIFIGWKARPSKFCSHACYAESLKGEKNPIKDRLMSGHAVDPETGCWEWKGRLSPKGYGRINVKGSIKMAHRVSYETFVGSIDKSRPCVCHQCDNPACINPEHLFLGTKADNNIDMHQKGRNNQPKGEASKAARLTDLDVLEARCRYAAGERVGVIALSYPQVHKNTLKSAIYGYTWKHLPSASQLAPHSKSENTQLSVLPDPTH